MNWLDTALCSFYFLEGVAGGGGGRGGGVVRNGSLNFCAYFVI